MNSVKQLKTILTCTITIDHDKVTKPPENVNTPEELHQYFADLFNECVLEELLGVDDIDQVNEIDGVSVEIGDRLEGEEETQVTN